MGVYLLASPKMDTSFITLCTSVLLLLQLTAAQLQEQPLTVNIGEVTDCPDHPKPTISLHNMTLRVDPETGDLYANTTIVLEEPLEDPMQIRFEVFRCVSKSEDSCSLPQVLERKTICDVFDKKGMVWSYLLEKVEGIEIKCPVPVGTYKLVDGPITKGLRETTPMTPGHWRLKTTLIKNGRTVACTRGYGEVKVKRRSRG